MKPIKKYLIGENLSALHLKPSQLSKLQIFIKLATPGKSALQISQESEGKLESSYCAELRKVSKLTRRKVKLVKSYAATNDGKKCLKANPELIKLRPEVPKQLDFLEVLELVLKKNTTKEIRKVGGTRWYVCKAYRVISFIRSGAKISVMCKMCLINHAEALAAVKIYNEFEKSKAEEVKV